EGTVHHHDRSHNVVLVIPAGLSKPWHIADIDAGNILDLHGYTVHLGQRDALDVVDLAALRQIARAAAVDQPDAASVYGLLADIDAAGADIDVRIADCGDQLLEGDAVGL